MFIIDQYSLKVKPNASRKDITDGCHEYLVHAMLLIRLGLVWWPSALLAEVTTDPFIVSQCPNTTFVEGRMGASFAIGVRNGLLAIVTF